MNLKKRFKQLASLLTCAAIFGVMLCGGYFKGSFVCLG